MTIKKGRVKSYPQWMMEVEIRGWCLLFQFSRYKQGVGFVIGPGISVAVLLMFCTLEVCLYRKFDNTK